MHKNDPDFDGSSVEKELIVKYMEVQNHLLSYDLSDIPFEAWENMTIVSDEEHSADFSKTKANIDFNLVECVGNANFKSCNIRNLERISRQLNPDNFDDETIKKNQNLFLSENFSQEFINKYYSNSIGISDLATLNNQQLDEVKQKDITSHIVGQEFSHLLIKTIGIDKIVQLYNYSLEEYKKVNEILNFHSGLYRTNQESKDLPSFEEFLEQIASDKEIDVSSLNGKQKEMYAKVIGLTDELDIERGISRAR